MIPYSTTNKLQVSDNLENDGTFYYKLLNDDSYMIGQNLTKQTSERGNAFVGSVIVQDTLVIPDHFNQKQ